MTPLSSHDLHTFAKQCRTGKAAMNSDSYGNYYMSEVYATNKGYFARHYWLICGWRKQPREVLAS